MPMSPGARKFAHYSGYVQPLIVAAAGLACLVALFLWLSSGEPVDIEGIVGLSLLGLGGLGFGAYLLWRSRQGATTPLQSVNDLPPAEGARQTRNFMWIVGIASILAAAFMAYELARVEFGSAQSVVVWAPVAMMYDFFGFWPAVSFIPVLGLVILVVLARKLRALRESQTRRI